MLGFDPVTHDYRMIAKLKQYLQTLIQYGGSDLHIKANAPVYARIEGDIIPMTKESMSAEDVKLLAKELLRTRYEELIKNKDVDLIFSLNEEYRFRANIFFQIDGVSAVFRVIPTQIKSIDELGLPESVKKITELKRGLVLVTGITGSGKSTTMAAILDAINNIRAEHIVTIEDPVEFVHKNKNCIINQRSLGQDTPSYARALRAALREDPDIIVVGEMRDLETIEMALHAAETGHLVLSTLHTLDAKDTINRIVSVFPVEEQNRIRLILSSVLEAILSQRLVKTVDGKRTAALEILFKTERIASMIAEEQDMDIRDAIEEGKIYGMQSFNQALANLYARGIISKEEALLHASSKSNLNLIIDHIDKSQDEFVGRDSDIIDLKIK
ncbi:twitching motility protein PilT [Nitratiruptor sp. YY08-26]|uniref:type IV pilus twitching motility protein PilT n=1 Tax=unclassified Nitratiruptor TaxID=2624044 RepID=UPI00193650CE|nr:MULTISPECIES: PilT/PilU family type 4a pilus ATPase [unclassified Nitratiruptor]BCD61567.1 twitching motility protein PilT [Nitratiruptor sp. YY08-13]BCD65501.1 twitching motility protein PilT [Nitratiruptor sp. YY08-26]